MGQRRRTQCRHFRAANLIFLLPDHGTTGPFGRRRQDGAFRAGAPKHSWTVMRRAIPFRTGTTEFIPSIPSIPVRPMKPAPAFTAETTRPGTGEWRVKIPETGFRAGAAKISGGTTGHHSRKGTVRARPAAAVPGQTGIAALLRTFMAHAFAGTVRASVALTAGTARNAGTVRVPGRQGRHGRAELILADLAVAVLVQGFERGGGVGDFLGGELAILVGVQSHHQWPQE